MCSDMIIKRYLYLGIIFSRPYLKITWYSYEKFVAEIWVVAKKYRRRTNFSKRASWPRNVRWKNVETAISCLRQFFCIEPGSDQCLRSATPANCECEDILIEDEKHVKNYFRPSVRISFMRMQEEATFRFASVSSLAHTNAKSISKRTPSVVRARNQPK